MTASRGSNSAMKTKPTGRRKKGTKKESDLRLSLEDAYRKVFSSPMPAGPLRDRLSVYKSVPSVTTYGSYERP